VGDLFESILLFEGGALARPIGNTSSWAIDGAERVESGLYRLCYEYIDHR